MLHLRDVADSLRQLVIRDIGKVTLCVPVFVCVVCVSSREWLPLCLNKREVRDVICGQVAQETAHAATMENKERDRAGLEPVYPAHCLLS